LYFLSFLTLPWIFRNFVLQNSPMTTSNSKSKNRQRPVILSAEVRNNMSEIEKFQNTTIRPVIKMLHPILIISFKHYFQNKKNKFYDFSEEKRMEYITNIFQKDIAFKNELKGMVIGNFTTEEFESYQKISSESSKRILAMVKERILNSIHEFTQ